MLCHWDVEMFICSLTSFFYHLGRQLPVYVVDDGSLTPADTRLLKQFFIITIESRQSADIKMARKLARYKHFYAYRFSDNSIIFKLMFDALILSPFSKYFLLDADILFLAKPQELLDWLDSPKAICCYASLTREYQRQLTASGEYPMIPFRTLLLKYLKLQGDPFVILSLLGINTKAVLNLREIDRLFGLLSQVGYLSNRHVDEAIVATLLARKKAILLDPTKYYNAVAGGGIKVPPLPPEPVFIHFPGESKPQFWRHALGEIMRTRAFRL
jgi:lipopolysaccharide biosynthesis glycosyltransferase